MVVLVLGLLVQEVQAEAVLVMLALMEMERVEQPIPEAVEAVLLTSQALVFLLVVLVVLA